MPESTLPENGGFTRHFARQRVFDYLSEEDRYLTRVQRPQYRFGFIGCGIMGQEHMLNTRLEGRADIGGVYDPSSRSAHHALAMLKGTGEQPQIYASLEEAVADPATDALIIATPNHTHIEVIRAVAGCDKALFLEKPIATNIEDAMEIYRLLGAHPHYVQIGLQYRYKAIYREAIQEVFARRSLGRVFNVSLAEHRFPFLDKVDQWNKFSTNTGGTLVEKCCHYFDLLTLFAQAVPQRVFALGHQSVNFRDFEHSGQTADGLDNAQVLVDYEGGVTGQFSLNMFTHGSFEELVINGDRARLQATEVERFGDDGQNQVELWSQDLGSSRSVTPTYPAAIARAGHHGSTFYEHVALVDGLNNESNLEFAAADLTDAVWSVVIAVAAHESIRSGQAVEITSLRPSDLPDPVGLQLNQTGDSA